MAGNLPPGVTGNESYFNPPENPEPDRECPHCGLRYFGHDSDRRTVIAGPCDVLEVTHALCPDCGDVTRAFSYDMTDGLLRGWRDAPEEMEPTVDRYADLRAFDGTATGPK